MSAAIIFSSTGITTTTISGQLLGRQASLMVNEEMTTLRLWHPRIGAS